MDYRQHIAQAMNDIGNQPDQIAAVTELIKACGSCIAFLAAGATDMRHTMAVLDAVNNAMRIEAAEWFERQKGAPHGKPH